MPIVKFFFRSDFCLHTKLLCRVNSDLTWGHQRVLFLSLGAQQTCALIKTSLEMDVRQVGMLCFLLPPTPPMPATSLIDFSVPPYSLVSKYYTYSKEIILLRRFNDSFKYLPPRSRPKDYLVIALIGIMSIFTATTPPLLNLNNDISTVNSHGCFRANLSISNSINTQFWL